jgi:hypothetical protein
VRPPAVAASTIPRPPQTAQPSISIHVGATPKIQGARFMPTPKPAEARAKTNARSARVSPSSASSGARKTLNA